MGRKRKEEAKDIINYKKTVHSNFGYVLMTITIRILDQRRKNKHKRQSPKE